MGFGFVSPGLAPNSNAAPLVVQTNSTVWAPTLASLIDGSVTTAASVAPVRVPEPATLALLGVGGLAVMASARRRKAA